MKYLLIAVWFVGIAPAWVTFYGIGCQRDKASVSTRVMSTGLGALMWPAFVIGRVSVWGLDPTSASKATGCPADASAKT